MELSFMFLNMILYVSIYNEFEFMPDGNSMYVPPGEICVPLFLKCTSQRKTA